LEYFKVIFVIRRDYFAKFRALTQTRLPSGCSCG